MSSGLRLMQIGVAQAMEVAPVYREPSYQFDDSTLDTYDLVTLAQRASGELLIDVDSTANLTSEQCAAHETQIQQAISTKLISSVQRVLQGSTDDYDVVMQALRLYQPKSVDLLASVGNAIIDDVWHADEETQIKGATLLGVLGSGPDERKDRSYADEQRSLSEIKAELIVRTANAVEVDDAKIEKLARLSSELSNNANWVADVDYVDGRITAGKVVATGMVTAAALTVAANPASAENAEPPTIITAGQPVAQQVVEAGDSPNIDPQIVQTPITKNAKITIVKAGTSIDQPITPTVLPVVTIPASTEGIDPAPIDVAPSTPSAVTTPDLTPTPIIVAGGDTTTNAPTPQNSAEQVLPSTPVNGETQAPETMPTSDQIVSSESAPSPEVVDTIDPIDQQIMVGDQLMPILRAAIKAKSYAVLQGGEAKPNDPSDTMSENLIGTAKTIMDWVEKTRDLDPETLRILGEGWDSWRDQVLDDPDNRYTQDERNQVQLIDTQIQQLLLDGHEQEANELGILATLNSVMQEMITDPQLYKEDKIDTPDTPEVPKVDPHAKNPFANFELGARELQVIDELAAHRHWKDYQKQIFIQVVTSAVRRAYIDHTSPVNQTSQSVLESNNYKDVLARNANNLFGMKGKGDAGTYSVPTHEWYNGKYVSIIGKFAAFKSIGSGIAFYNGHLMQLDHYQDARWFFRNPTLHALGLENELNRKGQIVHRRKMAYATSPTYEQTLQDMEVSLRLREIIPKEFFSNSKIPFDGTGREQPKVKFKYKSFHDNKEIQIPNVDEVVKRAKEIAATDFNDPDYKKFCPGNYKDGHYVRCYNLCDHIAAYVYGNAHSGHKTAYKHWKALQDENNVIIGTDREPPVGAMLFWGSGTGHVAVYLGNGKILSNDIHDKKHHIRGGMYIADATEIETKWGLKYHGWAIDGRLMHVNTDKIEAHAH